MILYGLLFVRCAMCDVRCAMCDVRCAMCDVCVCVCVGVLLFFWIWLGWLLCIVLWVGEISITGHNRVAGSVAVVIGRLPRADRLRHAPTNSMELKAALISLYSETTTTALNGPN
jgi:hypothetical protein